MPPVQAISNPFGITVFGSSVMRISPDIVALSFAVSRLAPQPAQAFQEVRSATQTVRAYLGQARLDDVSSSHIRLSESYSYIQSKREFEGYLAKVAFTVILRDLARLEEIIVGIVEAGVNEISSTDFQTSRLKELRMSARQQAVAAAREKAATYCAAAGVELGAVIHIEDVNPNTLHVGEGHGRREMQIDDDAPIQAFDPGSIEIGGAVLVSFRLASADGQDRPA